ncbi:MAG: tyrosine-protein phosphatase [Steroidobacteraceae bacterium]|jgi:protein-tyrosine phosphatase|nr:tyrosine-protein phosphatase [Steroidobacteraceae bacterium]
MKTMNLRALGGALLATWLLGACATPPAPQARPTQAIATPSTGGLPRAADAGRLVPLQGALNVRSFDGLRGSNGPIPASSFIRAADLNRLTAADRDLLAARGVVLDLDLRTAEEASGSSDPLAADDRFRYVRISLLGTEKLDLANMPDDLGTMYVQSLAANQTQFRQVFETLAAQQDGTVLFHCTAGKDRTGMIAAMLLSLAGVPRSEIVHNYTISAHYLEPMMRQNPQAAEMVRQNPKVAALMGTPAESIEAFLDALDGRHGGARAYLRTIGVSDGDVRRLLVRMGQAR